MKKIIKNSFALICCTALGMSVCAPVALAKRDGAPKNKKIDFSKIPDAVPKVEKQKKNQGQKSYVIKGKRYNVLKSAQGYSKVGEASWYGTAFHGKKTASGKRYNLYAMTAASPNLPLHTYVKVKNLENGKSVVVEINDRGPFKKNRIIDLSWAAANKLGYAKKGTARIQATAISSGTLVAAKSAPALASNQSQLALLNTQRKQDRT